MHAAGRGRRRLKIAVEFRVVGGEVRPATCHGPTCLSIQVRRVFLNAGPVPQIRSLQSAWNSSHFPKDNHRLRGNGSQSMAPTTKPSPPKCPARAKHAPICIRHSKSVSNSQSMSGQLAPAVRRHSGGRGFDPRNGRISASG